MLLVQFIKEVNQPLEKSVESEVVEEWELTLRLNQTLAGKRVSLQIPELRNKARSFLEE